MIYASGALLLMGYLKGFFTWMETLSKAAAEKKKSRAALPQQILSTGEIAE
jgi:hypothetical protein